MYIIYTCIDMLWCRLLHELWSGKAKYMTSSYFQHLYQLSVAEKEIIRGGLMYSHYQRKFSTSLYVALNDLAVCVGRLSSMSKHKHMYVYCILSSSGPR